MFNIPSNWKRMGFEDKLKLLARICKAHCYDGPSIHPMMISTDREGTVTGWLVSSAIPGDSRWLRSYHETLASALDESLVNAIGHHRYRKRKFRKKD